MCFFERQIAKAASRRRAVLTIAESCSGRSPLRASHSEDAVWSLKSQQRLVYSWAAGEQRADTYQHPPAGSSRGDRALIACCRVYCRFLSTKCEQTVGKNPPPPIQFSSSLKHFLILAFLVCIHGWMLTIGDLPAGSSTIYIMPSPLSKLIIHLLRAWELLHNGSTADLISTKD